MEIRFYEVIDRKSTNPSLSHDGGDYTFWRIIAVVGNTPIAVSYRTSSYFPYCSYCGDFSHTESGCWRFGANSAETRDWEKGRRLEGKEYSLELSLFLSSNWFNPIRWR